MRADIFWSQAEAELATRPDVLSSLRHGASLNDLDRWSRSVDAPLPANLREMYAIHDGTEVRGLHRFSFIAEWYPLPVEIAIERYEQWREMSNLLGPLPLIPFAVDPGGCYLAAPGDGTNELYKIFFDAPPALYDFYTFPPSLEGLLQATIDGLRGNSPDYRIQLNEQSMSWINLEEEADDLGN
ncbi:hypothetical protein F1D05_22025 [Kribbella qitaiheensis]|uniref:SMI1/KNR4 family protein n=1 Tax=Kribbella qitaiheensis TaxID=1544730 RepID=A0A7G6X1I6_9ACTN|nr:hypothetical protein [Kribbella qitaiheensis]QNE20101.1 hypothetical protein F1D05_22025 [Kribbella qitaiheensis]